jgi:hypothetical protein
MIAPKGEWDSTSFIQPPTAGAPSATCIVSCPLHIGVLSWNLSRGNEYVMFVLFCVDRLHSSLNFCTKFDDGSFGPKHVNKIMFYSEHDFVRR